MTRPRLLDLYCGAGGAAMGYHRAGFDVVGVDAEPQPHYPFEFHQADALSFEIGGFDAIHASPPCQRFSALSRATKNGAAHPDLVDPTRQLLIAAGVPWVIENVPGAPLDGFTLCGASFGLRIVRHRVFECSIAIPAPPCTHTPGGTTDGTYIPFRDGGRVAPGRTRPPARRPSEWRDAAGLSFMTCKEARQAVPPAYTEFIGLFLNAAARR